MHRRNFLATSACAVALPAAARAQAARTVAWLSPTRAEDGTIFLDALIAGLRDLARHDIRVEAYWGEDSPQRLAEIVAAAVRARPVAIVAQGSTAVAAARATKDIPLVFGYSGDPVEAGMVSSLPRPGGNATGISYMSLELVAKRMEILREVLPAARRIAVLANPQHPGDLVERRVSQAAADALGIEMRYFEARSAAELPAALAAIGDAGADAAMMFPVQTVISRRADIAAWSHARRIPAISGWAQFAQGGNLLSYGANLRDATRRLATFVARVVDGAKPADLPVELPTVVELVVNLRTARALGVEIPVTLLARADEVIE
jgi:putative ABC transport system substrate-binding protein